MPDDTRPADAAVLHVLGVGKDGGKHSPLYLWMQEHYSTLKAEFETRGPQWEERAVAMAEAGLRDGTNKEPTQRTAMQTWYRVCRAQKRRGSISPPSAETTPLPLPPSTKRPNRPVASTIASPPPVAAPGDDADSPDFDFRFAGGLKDWTKKPG